MLDAKAAHLIEVNQAHALYEHWDGERAALRKYNTTLIPPPAALETCKRILALAGSLAVAKHAVSSFVSTDREFYRERHWALWLLEKDFEEHAAAPTVEAKPSGYTPERIAAERAKVAADLAAAEASGEP